MCDKGFTWNPSNYECECDKSCDVGEYLDYENCKCRKELVDKLFDECTEAVEEVKLAKITLAENENECKCSSCTLHVVLFSIVFIINIGGISAYFDYWRWYLKKDVTLLSLILVLKQQFNYLTYKWEKSNKLTLKNQTQYFYNDIINLKDFEPNLLKIDKKHYKGMNIYYTGYITIKKIDDFESIYSINPLYLRINHASGYIQEKNGNKYLILDDYVDENKEVLKKFADVWNGIKNKIKTINGGKENDYGKDYMKIKFNSDDDLPLNKPLKFHAMTIIIRSVFEDGKLYPQLF